MNGWCPAVVSFIVQCNGRLRQSHSFCNLSNSYKIWLEKPFLHPLAVEGIEDKLLVCVIEIWNALLKIRFTQMNIDCSLMKGKRCSKIKWLKTPHSVFIFPVSKARILIFACCFTLSRKSLAIAIIVLRYTILIN